MADVYSVSDYACQVRPPDVSRKDSLLTKPTVRRDAQRRFLLVQLRQRRPRCPAAVRSVRRSGHLQPIWR